MSVVYVTGHRNPDFDSIAAPLVYAHLMGHVNRDIQYVPVRCGNLNRQTRGVIEKLGVPAPEYRKDVKIRVIDVVSRDVPKLTITDPLQTAIAQLDDTGLSILPVFDEGGGFIGTISSTEISHFLMRETFGARPKYRFLVKNLAKVIPGRLLSAGAEEEIVAPVMIGAMPYERSVERIISLDGDLPLFIVGQRKDLISYAVDTGFPAVILTGVRENERSSLELEGYKGAVYLSDVDTAETIRLLRFSTPLHDIIEPKTERLDVADDFDVAKKKLADSGRRGLPVFRDGEFAGIVSRGSFLDKPKKRLVLVDHNEVDQSIPGAREAEILEIVDHHRVGAVMSREPFSLNVRPVGCTCTILHKLYRQYGVALPTEMALLMLSAILSDTVLLKSPTTTDEDRTAVDSLSRHAGVDAMKWGEDIFSSVARPEDLNPKAAVSADFKKYEMGDLRFGIGQTEVQTLAGIDEASGGLVAALDGQMSEEGLAWVLLLLTDVVNGDSVLFSRGLDETADRLPYEKTSQGRYFLPGILSRKKQLLPEVFRAIEETELRSER